MNKPFIGRRSSYRLNRRRGLGLIYTMATLIALTAFVSLGVDYGRVQIARSEASAAADAAAAAGAKALLSGLPAARARAIEIAAMNTVDGTSVKLEGTDVELGTWDKA